MDFPYLCIIINRKANPKQRSSHHGAPKPAGKVPINSATAPETNAYGICVRTWSISSHPEAMDVRIVVSDIGEQWSAQTAPVRTQAIVE